MRMLLIDWSTSASEASVWMKDDNLSPDMAERTMRQAKCTRRHT